MQRLKWQIVVRAIQSIHSRMHGRLKNMAAAEDAWAWYYSPHKLPHSPLLRSFLGLLISPLHTWDTFPKYVCMKLVFPNFPPGDGPGNDGNCTSYYGVACPRRPIWTQRFAYFAPKRSKHPCMLFFVQIRSAKPQITTTTSRTHQDSMNLG